MSDAKRPREFWIRHESILPGYGCKEKHAYESEQPNSTPVISKTDAQRDKDEAIVRLTNDCVSVCKRLREKNDDLEQKLVLAVEALEFYSDREQWNIAHAPDGKSGFIHSSDFDEFNFGGKRARAALAKIGGKDE